MKIGLKWKTRVMAALSAGVLAVTGTMTAGTGFTASAEDLGLDNYAKLLQYSLYFFDANMCGSGVGENSAFSWRDDCHTGDVVAGGFHDAGDAIKCGLTAGFTASTLGWTYYEYQDQFEKTGTTEHYKVIMDYFCDFFKESTTLSNGEVTSFVYEIGNDGSDHSTWCAPETMWDHGSSETYSTTNGASNVAAQYAAALAQNYMLFGDEEDLTYATALYNFAAKYRTMTYEESTYSDKDVQDDISWAAGWMYLATGEDAYLTENSKYTSSTNDWTNDYYYGNAWLGAAIINAEITGNWSNAVNYIDSKVNANQNQFYVMNSWGSARHNTLMQLCAMVCTKHSAESGKDYSEWCQKQMNYILGDNNANVCLVVGYNSLSATSPHHRAASNLTVSSDWHEWNSWDGNYASTGGHTLYGALVGGPTSSDFTTYNPSAQDATSNEVALDYQIGLVGAAAGLYAAYGTGKVVAEIGDEVTVYPSEVAAANGEIIVDPADKWVFVPDTIEVGLELAVSVESVFSNSFTWKSSDPEVLKIEKDGDKTAVITACKEGTVTITATGNAGHTLSHDIKVIGSTVTTETSVTTEETTTTEMTTTVITDTTAATEETTAVVGGQKWVSVPDTITALEEEIKIDYLSDLQLTSCESSDSEVLEIKMDEQGHVTVIAHKAGTAEIKLIFGDNIASLSHTIVVEDGAVTSSTEATAVTTETTASTETTTNTSGSSGEHILYGDVNLDGRVDITDAVLLNKKACGAVMLNDAAMKNADCNVDNEVNNEDAILLLKFLVHMVTSIGQAE